MAKLLCVATLLLCVGYGSALPLLYNESTICSGGLCEKTPMKYERTVSSQPGYQWDDAGGYCGSWAIQRATLAQGAWFSQQQVRDHTSAGGGHDNEILSTNIEEALTNLKIDYEGFDFKSTPLPQLDAYFKWLKKQLSSGYAVAWMILWSGQDYPIYDLTPPAGMYGHVEPVIGIQSNHPLNDTNVYDDDVVLHFTDGGTNTVHRPLTSMKGSWAGPGSPARCGLLYSYCMGPYAFGWAVKGFSDNKEGAMQASLHIDPWESEPDLRSGRAPEELQGTLTATGLTVGDSYDIYRWGSSAEAFTYTDKFLKHSFTASNDTFVYVDDKSFMSNTTTYYRCVKH